MKTFETKNIAWLLVGALVCGGCSSLSSSRRHSEQEIRVAVLKDHVSRRLVNIPNYQSGYEFFVLDVASEYESKSLTEYFRNSRPPILCGTKRVVYGDRGIALDGITGKEVVVFDVSITSFTATMSRATSTTYTSNTGGERFNYTLVLTNGQWQIIAREYAGES